MANYHPAGHIVPIMNKINCASTNPDGHGCPKKGPAQIPDDTEIINLDNLDLDLASMIQVKKQEEAQASKESPYIIEEALVQIKEELIDVETRNYANGGSELDPIVCDAEEEGRDKTTDVGQASDRISIQKRIEDQRKVQVENSKKRRAAELERAEHEAAEGRETEIQQNSVDKEAHDSEDEGSLFEPETRDERRPRKKAKANPPQAKAPEQNTHEEEPPWKIPGSELEEIIQSALQNMGNNSKKAGKRARSGEKIPKAPKTKDKSNGGTRAKTTAKSKFKGKKMSRKEQQLANVTNLAGLANVNVFNDVENNRGYTFQPTATAKTKLEALKQLLESVPEEYQQIAKADKAQLDKATREFNGKGHCKPDGNGGWIITGMKSSLTSYQMLGVSFMRHRESLKKKGNSSEPYGGLLADSMGLGKTVMTIACIVDGHPKRIQEKRPTLIVAPPSILAQWQNEIAKHADEKYLGSVIRYCSGNRIESNNIPEAMNKFDIILTTYPEVIRSFPSGSLPDELLTKEEREEWYKNYYTKNLGVLHQMKFERVVLDEAQAIKNYLSKTSRACVALSADFRWAISGTPIQNTLQEFYPLFKFLHVPATGDFQTFKKDFCTEKDPKGTARLLVWLTQFMVRRTHADTFMGAKLLDLPPSRQETVGCAFNEIEKSIYEIVHKRFVTRINKMCSQGQFKKKYCHIFTMLLRLRQLTTHILLIQETMADLLEPSDIDELKKVLDVEVKPHQNQIATIVHLRRILQTTKPKKMPSADVETTEDALIETHPAPRAPLISTGGAFAQKDNTKEFLESLADQKANECEDVEPVMCQRCKMPPYETYTMSCGHSYCWECLQILSYEAAEKGQDRTKCVECGQEFEGFRTTNSEPVNPEPANGADGEKVGSKKAKPKEAMPLLKWIDALGHMLPSTKTTAIKAQILNWLEQDPKTKIIVYTQFRTVIRILAKMCEMEKWGACQFHGCMSIADRSKTVQEFETEESMNIMLASLKCGGTGLNLTMASKVIVVEPWWNSAVEQQAFCRIFRRGQEKETEMKRIVVQGSVDGKLLKMQERKDKEINSVMSDDEKITRRLSETELLELFGPVGHDDNGNPFICTN